MSVGMSVGTVGSVGKYHRPIFNDNMPKSYSYIHRGAVPTTMEARNRKAECF